VGGGRSEFVPHLSITVTLMSRWPRGSAYYFLNHIATRSASDGDCRHCRDVAAEMSSGSQCDFGLGRRAARRPKNLARLQSPGPDPHTKHGYLQVIRHETLLKIASAAMLSFSCLPPGISCGGQVMLGVAPSAAGSFEKTLHSSRNGAYRTLRRHFVRFDHCRDRLRHTRRQ